jgi:hypothetical protein
MPTERTTPGTADSYAAYVAASAVVPATGGCVVFGAGTYKVSSTLMLGNGTSGGASTKEAPCIKGQGVGATTIKYAGTAGQPMVVIAGPLEHARIENVYLDGNNPRGERA